MCRLPTVIFSTTSPSMSSTRSFSVSTPCSIRWMYSAEVSNFFPVVVCIGCPPGSVYKTEKDSEITGPVPVRRPPPPGRKQFLGQDVGRPQSAKRWAQKRSSRRRGRWPKARDGDGLASGGKPSPLNEGRFRSQTGGGLFNRRIAGETHSRRGGDGDPPHAARPAEGDSPQAPAGSSGLLGLQLLEDLLEGLHQVGLVDRALAEGQGEVEGFVGSLETEDVGSPAAALGGFVLPQAAPEVVAVQAQACHLFQEADHLLLTAGLEDLEEQRLGGDAERLDSVADPRRHLQQGQALGDHRARLPHRLGDLLVRIGVPLGELAEPLGFLEGRQVLALEGLDQRDLERLFLRDVHLDRRHLVEAGFLRRPKAPLAGDDPVDGTGAVADRTRPDQDRLEDSLGADRRYELVEISQDR